MTEKNQEPFRLNAVFSERVWGKTDLTPWYPQTFEHAVGEAWLTTGECRVETGSNSGKRFADIVAEEPGLLGAACTEFPLLIKLLFPREKLSVQVHPDDEHAARIGGSARGKTECWYVLEAEPGASIALGFRDGVTLDDVHAALGRPEFEQLLHMQELHVGDMIYVDAGTVHAIGPGSTLLEVQQTSDTTFRLYDYGRPRELHLQAGFDVLRMKTAAGLVPPKKRENVTELIRTEYFIVERIDLSESASQELFTDDGPESIVPIAGNGTLTVDSEETQMQVGKATIVPASVRAYKVNGPCSVVRARVPRR